MMFVRICMHWSIRQTASLLALLNDGCAEAQLHGMKGSAQNLGLKRKLV